VAGVERLLHEMAADAAGRSENGYLHPLSPAGYVVPRRSYDTESIEYEFHRTK
jgi:hypothetical protein